MTKPGSRLSNNNVGSTAAASCSRSWYVMGLVWRLLRDVEAKYGIRQACTGKWGRDQSDESWDRVE